jgi:hypothetical protein
MGLGIVSALCALSAVYVGRIVRPARPTADAHRIRWTS